MPSILQKVAGEVFQESIHDQFRSLVFHLFSVIFIPAFHEAAIRPPPPFSLPVRVSQARKKRGRPMGRQEEGKERD